MQGAEWWGIVTAETGISQMDPRRNRIVVHSHKWVGVPPPGTMVKIVELYRSPYWALVDDE